MKKIKKNIKKYGIGATIVNFLRLVLLGLGVAIGIVSSYGAIMDEFPKFRLLGVIGIICATITIMGISSEIITKFSEN